MAISKIEFISSTEIAVASPTILATYTNIYDEKFSDKEDSSPVGYFIQSPRTLDFQLDIDTFLLDEVFDSLNDKETGSFSSDKLLTQFKYFCDKIIRVFENDVYTFTGILSPNDIFINKEEQKIDFKASDPLILITNIQDFTGVSDDISNTFQNILMPDITDQFLGASSYSRIPVIESYFPKGNIFWTSIEIEATENSVGLGNTGSYLGAFWSNDINYIDLVRVWKVDIDDIGGAPEYRYSYMVRTYSKLRLVSSRTSDWFLTLAELNTDLTNLGYSSTTTATGDISKTLEDGVVYEAESYSYYDFTGNYNILFTGYAFITLLHYTDRTTTTYAQFLDIVTTIDDIQIQLSIESNIPTFTITNRDVTLGYKGILDTNDVIELDYERIQIEEPKYDVFAPLDEDFKDDIVSDIKYYYSQYLLSINNQISFILSNIANDYEIGLNHSFKFDGTDYKVARTSKESERVQKIEAKILVKTIEVLSPNGGESASSKYLITWSTLGISTTDNVTIELWKADIFDSTIVASTPNDGNYSWVITETAGTDYKIKILATDDTDTNDLSDNEFAIT